MNRTDLRWIHHGDYSIRLSNDITSSIKLPNLFNFQEKNFICRLSNQQNSFIFYSHVSSTYKESYISIPFHYSINIPNLLELNDDNQEMLQLEVLEDHVPIADQVILQPIETKDWEIASSQAILLEELFLLQHSIIVKSQCIRIMLSSSLFVDLQVNEMNPNMEILRLNQNTVIAISPTSIIRDDGPKSNYWNEFIQKKSILRLLPQVMRYVDTNDENKPSEESNDIDELQLLVNEYLTTSSQSISTSSRMNGIAYLDDFTISIHPNSFPDDFDRNEDVYVHIISNSSSSQTSSHSTLLAKCCFSLQVRPGHISIPMNMRHVLQIQDYELVQVRQLDIHRLEKFPSSIEIQVLNTSINELNLSKEVIMEAFLLYCDEYLLANQSILLFHDMILFLSLGTIGQSLHIRLLIDSTNDNPFNSTNKDIIIPNFLFINTREIFKQLYSSSIIHVFESNHSLQLIDTDGNHSSYRRYQQDTNGNHLSYRRYQQDTAGNEYHLSLLKCFASILKPILLDVCLLCYNHPSIPKIDSLVGVFPCHKAIKGCKLMLSHFIRFISQSLPLASQLLVSCHEYDLLAYRKTSLKEMINSLSHVMQLAIECQPSVILLYGLDALFSNDEEEDMSLEMKTCLILHVEHWIREIRYHRHHIFCLSLIDMQLDLASISGNSLSSFPLFEKKYHLIDLDFHQQIDILRLVLRYEYDLLWIEDLTTLQVDVLISYLPNLYYDQLHDMARYIMIHMLTVSSTTSSTTTGTTSSSTTSSSNDAMISIPSDKILQLIEEYHQLHYLPSNEINNKSSPSHHFVSWDDLKGYDHIKQQLVELIQYPIIFKQLYDLLPHSKSINNYCLLYGPSGCGKTTFVYSIAKHLKYQLRVIHGPELLNKYIGSSEKAIRQLFHEMTQSKYPIILFFDEFDSFVPKRGNQSNVTDRLINQLLTLLDGIEVNKTKNMFIICASSRPDLIDSALLRPGRIDQHLYIGYPKTSNDYIDIFINQIIKYIPCDDIIRQHLTSLCQESKMMDLTPADIQAIVYSTYLNSLKCHSIDNDSMDKISISFCQELQHQFHGYNPSITAHDKYQLFTSFSKFWNPQEMEYHKKYLNNIPNKVLQQKMILM